MEFDPIYDTTNTWKGWWIGLTWDLAKLFFFFFDPSLLVPPHFPWMVLLIVYCIKGLFQWHSACIISVVCCWRRVLDPHKQNRINSLIGCHQFFVYFFNCAWRITRLPSEFDGSELFSIHIPHDSDFFHWRRRKLIMTFCYCIIVTKTGPPILVILDTQPLWFHWLKSHLNLSTLLAPTDSCMVTGDLKDALLWFTEQVRQQCYSSRTSGWTCNRATSSDYTLDLN